MEARNSRPKRRDQRLQMGFHFLRHADFDAFGFGVSDVHGFGQAGGQAVAAQFDRAAQA
jgi:hypothetical protein